MSSYESKLAEARAIIEGYERPSELNEIDLGVESLYEPIQERKTSKASKVSKQSIKDFAVSLVSM